MGFEAEKALEDIYVMHTFGRKPVEFVRGEGMHLYDDEGREYLDFLSGIGVVSLGHCHPALVAAIQGQAQRLIHVSNYYYIEGRGRLAQRLSELLALEEGPDAAPWQTFFANSGAEANECAIKLARLYARFRSQHPDRPCAKRLIVTLERSFHGRTLATLAATAQPVKQEIFQPLPDGFIATPANDIEALRRLFEERGAEICAILLEPVQGECGVYPCSRDFLQEARRLTEAHGALLMMDEVQCGMFRCGTYPFAFQHFGLQPDVVTMAKGIAGGVPMGACSARESVAAVFEPGVHGSTFGGSNLAVAAAGCVLDTVQAEGLAANAAQVGSYLKERLAAIPAVAEVRGLGLMAAADLAEGFDANAVVLAALRAGLVLNATGPRTLRFLPPLICSREDVDAMAATLESLL